MQSGRSRLWRSACYRLSQDDALGLSSRPGHRPANSAHLESPLAFPGPDEDAEEIATLTRRFTLAEITSGLPGDSREADERDETRRLRDLRGRVRAARAAISTAPGGEEVLLRDWQKAARFSARFGVTEHQFRHGVPAVVTCEVSRRIPSGA